MATGVVSIAAWDFQLSVLAMGLFAFNVVAYGVVAGLTALRAIRYPRLFFADMTDHRLGPGFFTAVAGSCILGTQFLLMAHSLAAAIVFLALGTALWVGLTYTIFTALTVKRDKPPLEKGLTGAWLPELQTGDLRNKRLFQTLTGGQTRATNTPSILILAVRSHRSTSYTTSRTIVWSYTTWPIRPTPPITIPRWSPRWMPSCWRKWPRRA